MTTDLVCEVCHGESGGTFVGVASVPGAPVSIAWCSECLQRDCAPTFVFEHDFIFVANGDPARLHEWALSRVTWADGRYMPFTEYVARISADDVRRGLEEYEAALRTSLAGAEPDE